MSCQYTNGEEDPLRLMEPAEVASFTQTGKRLRILILETGKEDRAFHTILAANIRHWGYEAVLLDAEEARSTQEGQQVVGDILVYDLDTLLPPMIVWGDIEEEVPFPTHFARVARRDNWPLVRLVIALSSRSISRRSLEQVGAVALLHKPFDMRYLERYLRVFQKLLSAEGEEKEVSQRNGQTRPLRACKDETDQALLARRILVADDCRDITWAIHQCLIEQDHQRYHYEVREAHDGLALLEQYLAWRPHCVVTDLLMPWLNGYQVMRCLADCTVQPLPAFVVISALMQHEIPVDRSYLRDQVVYYVSKPFDVENVLAVIEQALAK